MSLTTPLSLLQFPGQYFDTLGNPLAGGLIYFFEAGTSTPLNTYADVNMDAANTNPVVLDSSGFATIFLLPELYDVFVHDSTDTLIYSRLGVGNPGQIVYAGLGNTLATGATNVTSGYSVLSTDQLVTVASTGGANPCIINLPTAATRSSTNGGNGLPLTIKNLGTIPLHVTPSGADTIEGIAGAYTVAASASPLFRTITLVSTGQSAWWITGGIGV